MTVGLADDMARRAAERAVADRQADYAREVHRIVDATFRLVERTGTLQPSLRELLAETGLSTQAFYRYFRSKDELLLVVLDEGRRLLVGYLEARMARAGDPAGAVEAWVRGVLAQASDERAAARTRPFAASEDRIAERFPEEHARSVARLRDLLAGPVSALRPGGDVDGGTRVVYDLTFATLRRHLAAGTRPEKREAAHLVRFVLDGLGEGP